MSRSRIDNAPAPQNFIESPHAGHGRRHEQQCEGAQDEPAAQRTRDWLTDAGLPGDKIAIVRRDLPRTQPLFSSMGELRSVTFTGRGERGDDVYALVFANGEGIYLHDNPERELFTEASRLYSGGCVRLEDAARLGRWMFGYDLDWESAGTEQRVPLKEPVPVYITYLTALPDGPSSIAYYDDVYGRDAARLAATSSANPTSGSAIGNR